MSKKILEKLKKEIQAYDYEYYVLDSPSISDYKYDQLYKKLQKMEEENPQWVELDSPTQRVPGQALDHFEKVPHRKMMLSLENSYSIEDIRQFIGKTSTTLSKKKVVYFCEPKLDGVAVELIYEKGLLTYALTRGDGQTGENILENIKTIKSVPLRLKTNKPPSIFEVRAEVLIFKRDFIKLNKEQEKRSEKIFANPRNASAGALRNLDPQIASNRKLRLFCHGPGIFSGLQVSTQGKFYELLKQFQLPVLSYSQSLNKNWKNLSKPLCVICNTAEELISYYHTLQKLRPLLPFEIDGAVIKVNSFKDQETLGSIARSPKWATAVKFPPESAYTQIQKIHLQVGRTGMITPVARMKPISVGGVIVSQATLHNKSEIQKKDIREKDFVRIKRAGDVIPEVIEVDLTQRPKNTKPFKMPKTCPACSNKLKEIEDLMYCTNTNCPSITLRKLQHFCSKKAMDIETLGYALIEQLFNKSLIQCFSDIYKLKKENLNHLPGIGDKLSAKIISHIEKSKKTSFNRFLFALGIRHVGEQIALKIGEHFGGGVKGLEKLLKAKEEELIQIDDVGIVVAQSLVTELKNLSQEIQNLLNLDIKLISKHKGHKLKGKTFVITGSFQQTRNSISDLIQTHGGNVSSSITSKTNYLLYGENPGSKYDKAKKLNISCINWQEFEQILHIKNQNLTERPS